MEVVFGVIFYLFLKFNVDIYFAQHYILDLPSGTVGLNNLITLLPW